MKPMECYRDLEEAVWKKNLCTSCGACSTVCPSRTIVFNNFLPATSGNCKVVMDHIPCGACYRSCGNAITFEPIENTQKVYAGRSSVPVPHAQSGGAVTSLLITALESGLIDGALLMGVDQFTHRPRPVVVRNREQILAASGSRYSWGNVLEGLGDAVKSGLRRIAVVGTPCAVKSVRRIMSSNLDVLECYGACVRFTIGVFCSGIFRNLEEAVSRTFDISPWKIHKMEIKDGSVHVHTNNGIREIPFSVVKNDVLPGCPSCTDFTSRFADISAGNIGSKEGYTTLIIRTPEGDALVSEASERGNLMLSDDVDLAAVEKAARKKRGKV